MSWNYKRAMLDRVPRLAVAQPALRQAAADKLCSRDAGTRAKLTKSQHPHTSVQKRLQPAERTARVDGARRSCCSTAEQAL